jgi:hypothetical protein
MATLDAGSPPPGGGALGPKKSEGGSEAAAARDDIGHAETRPLTPVPAGSVDPSAETEPHPLEDPENLVSSVGARPVMVTGERSGDLLETARTTRLMRSQLKPKATSFVQGDLVAGRYRVARFVAQGGMGEVYEAEDEHLGVLVALKTVKPEVARDGRTIARFKREIRLARQVTHPNVCRTFDLGLHEGADGLNIPFLTMELLAGETLGRRLRQKGRMTADEALPIARQMASALDAAHKVGIVHRDFKSDNVVLMQPTQVDAGKGDVRAVVTDFGLARATLTGTLTPSLSATGIVIGTPEYMAPEQVEGRDVTAAADIYSLGIVLFEMVTGRLPFTQTSSQPNAPLEVAVKRLTVPAPSPRDEVPDLDLRWERTILRCLERKPEDRFATAEEVGRALAGEETQATVAQAPSRKRALFLLPIILALGAGALVVIRQEAGLGRGRTTPPADPVTGLNAAIAEAKSEAAVQGESADAEARLQQLAEQATQDNLPQMAFEARLALGEVQIATKGEEAQGAITLQALAKDARAAGYTAIAQQAATESGQPQ